jgi:outer membrane protein TolC
MSRKYTAKWLLVILPIVGFGLSGCSAVTSQLDNQEVATFADQLGADLHTEIRPSAGVITSDEAVMRAIEFNHAIRVKELEATVAAARAEALTGGMLPSVVARSEYYQRDRQSRSQSRNDTGFSSSSDKISVSSDVMLSWNIFDFGLAYVRARQGLDRAFQQREEAMRARLRIVEETRSAYWRAVAERMLDTAVPGMDREVEQALQVSRKAYGDPAVDPMAPINFQREILGLQRDLNQLKTSLGGSSEQLRQTIGIPVGSALRLQTYRGQDMKRPLASSARADVALALRQRPEIRGHLYDIRISEDEAYAAILQALPGISLTSGALTDSNSFLLYANWLSLSAKIAGNLINLVRLPAELETNEAQLDVHRQNALATAATIAMQVHVARARVDVQLQAYRDARRFAATQRDLLRQVRVSVSLGKVGQQAVAREKLSTLIADVRTVVAFADLNAALAAYASSKGDEPIRHNEYPARVHPLLLAPGAVVSHLH